MPLRTISSMMGRTLAANRLALAFKAALPRFATSAMSGLPRRFPRRLAAAKASLVRFEICSRSCSGHGSEDMHCELVGFRHIHSHELNAAFHQCGDEG